MPWGLLSLEIDCATCDAHSFSEGLCFLGYRTLPSDCKVVLSLYMNIVSHALK